jgi:hypothetical protein
MEWFILLTIFSLIALSTHHIMRAVLLMFGGGYNI